MENDRRGGGQRGGGQRGGFGAGLALGLMVGLGAAASLAWAHGGGAQTTPRGSMGPPICRAAPGGGAGAATETADWMQRMTLSGRAQFVAVPGPEGSVLCAW
jgi:hypothetical protein